MRQTLVIVSIDTYKDFDFTENLEDIKFIWTDFFYVIKNMFFCHKLDVNKTDMYVIYFN